MVWPSLERDLSLVICINKEFLLTWTSTDGPVIVIVLRPGAVWSHHRCLGMNQGFKSSSPAFRSTLRELQIMSSWLLCSLVESLFGLDSLKGDLGHVTDAEG